MDTYMNVVLIVMVAPQIRLLGADRLSETFQRMKDRMKDYDRNIFPRCESITYPVPVVLDIALRQILDLSEQQQLLEASTWMRWSWKDCRLDGTILEGNATDYVSVAANQIWIPDITLYEHVGEPLHTMQDYPAKIYADGTVSYNFPAVIKVVCKIQMEKFPFDRQVCKLTFGSWMYLVNEINVTAKNSHGDQGYYVHNGEWGLLDLLMERHEIKYVGWDQPFVDVTFYIVLLRRPTYYIFNIIFPTMLVGLVSVLSFSLPSAAGEKVSLSVTSLLTQTVFMLMLSQEMPSTSESIPLIQRYFAAILCIVSSCTIMTIVVLNIHFRGEHGRPVPRYLRLLFLNNWVRKFCQLPEKTNNSNMDFYRVGISQKQLKPKQHMLSNGEIIVPPISTITKAQPTDQLRPQGSRLTSDASLRDENLSARVSEMLTRICDKQIEKTKMKAIVKDWEDFASVVDRLFLMTSFTSLAVVTTVILFG